MDRGDSELDRLLRAAAERGEDPPVEVPFGFDTRVVALWHSQNGHQAADAWALARLVRRVAALAVAVIALASAGTYWQFRQNEALGEPFANEYAIADNAIETGALQ